MSEGERVERWARRLHEMYEETAELMAWRTQDVCRVPWDELPEPNKRTMLIVVQRFLSELEHENRKEREVDDKEG